MNAVEIVRALKGKWHGSYGTAKCPAHRDRSPSLSLSIGADGKTLVKCHAGCSQDAVIGALTALSLWDGQPSNLRSFTPKEPEPNRNGAYAMRLWNECEPAPGTIIETYLASRGITTPIPSVLRFHPGLKHPDGGIWPAMVACVDGVEDFAIHRTFLKKDGTGKAPVPTRQKMMLGRCTGGAVRLAEPEERLCIAEGIETALSIVQATGRPTWAALSASGMKSITLLPSVISVTICADADDAGEAAAIAAGRRLKELGLEVKIARPSVGNDFNDALIAGGAA